MSQKLMYSFHEPCVDALVLYRLDNWFMSFWKLQNKSRHPTALYTAGKSQNKNVKWHLTGKKSYALRMAEGEKIMDVINLFVWTIPLKIFSKWPEPLKIAAVYKSVSVTFANAQSWSNRLNWENKASKFSFLV